MSTRTEVRHFLIVFDTVRQRIVSQEEFENDDAAATAYAELERQHRHDTGVEIVLVSADSIETIKRTHGNYFGVPTTSPFLRGHALGRA